MTKTVLKQKLLSKTVALTALAVIVVAGIAVPIVRADQYDDQIRSLADQNAAASDNVANLQNQAAGYQETINQLQVQINGIQAQIASSQAEQASLQQQIAAMQAQLDEQRALLKNDVKAMYVDGELSAIEMLATSKNLSDYVDKSEYRNAVQKKVQETLAKIAKLQGEMKQKKVQVDQLVANQQAQESQLAASRAQQASMLAYTQAQKDAFTSQIKANSGKIAELRRQQIIANARYNIGPAGVGVNCGGGYPAKWCNIAQDAVIDSWGMYNRECVSYTAFKVHQDFLAGRNSRDMPYWGGIGDAKMWDDNARRAGIPVDTNPTPGSIAISNYGNWGHAMYVEQTGTVNGQPAIYVSQYNAGYDGRYSEGWRYTTDLVFIHF